MVTLSGVAIGLYALIATALTALIGGFFDACNLVNLPPVVDAGGLTVDQCYAMSAAFIKSAPRGKEFAGEVLAMFFHVVVRIEQNFFLCSAIATWYALTQSRAARKPVHLFLCLLAFCCAGSDATFAGLPVGLGSTGLQLTEAAKATVVLPFIPIWSLISILNGIAFFTSPKEKKA
tara:strand:+ start:687 stop:1214 length:528 start_codon:yes stop_codon:yes gene_type:complete